MPLSGCATTGQVEPKLTLTKQMFECLDKPELPDMAEARDGAIAQFITRLEVSRDDCADQLDTVENHLEINGITITDTLVTGEKPSKPWWRF